LGRNSTLTVAGLEAALEQTSFGLDQTLPPPNDTVGHGRLRLGSVDAPPGPIPSTQNTAGPVLSGTPVIGATPVSGSGRWSPLTREKLTFAWSRCDGGGANCAAIGGATDSEYVVQPADLGSTLKVTVTATGAVGAASASALSGVVILPRPTYSSLPELTG